MFVLRTKLAGYELEALYEGKCVKCEQHIKGRSCYNEKTGWTEVEKIPKKDFKAWNQRKEVDLSHEVKMIKDENRHAKAAAYTGDYTTWITSGKDPAKRPRPKKCKCTSCLASAAYVL